MNLSVFPLSYLIQQILVWGWNEFYMWSTAQICQYSMDSHYTETRGQVGCVHVHQRMPRMFFKAFSRGSQNLLGILPSRKVAELGGNYMSFQEFSSVCFIRCSVLREVHKSLHQPGYCLLVLLRPELSKTLMIQEQPNCLRRHQWILTKMQ